MKIELSNNKRKCGIVTFHSAYNYGSVLQSYAMVMTMKNLGLDAEIIDFRHPHTTDMYEWRLWTPYKNWKWNLKDFILRGIFGIGKNREKVFRNFIETKLPLSQRVTNRNEISPYKYDVLVCGSDQIWNLASSGENDPIYFLDFGKTKCKFSYAASAGNSKFSPTEHDIYLRYLKNLKSIGVREQFLKDYIKDEFNLDSEVNPDPTFLLKAKEWEKLENKYFGMPKHYLLVYTLLKADETLAFAQKVGKKLKLLVVNICNTRGLRGKSSENVDFWWLDWQQYLTSPYTNSLSETFWCNYVFFNEAAKRTGHRPVIFHRWGGLGSHRYQIGFSGDANISYEALAFEPYFTATASNVGYGYWGHDLGGHMFSNEELVNNPNLVLRWIQFGVFTPIFRTHATNDSRIERRIWKFPNFPTILEAVRLRYSLFPYIYTMARKTYDTGISICRPLYYEYPEVEEAYTYDNEYFFGDDILVAPITEKSDANGITIKDVWLPEGKWWSVSTNELIEGPRLVTMSFTDKQIPYFYRQGALIPNNPADVMNVTERPSQLVLNIVSGENGKGFIYEDDGDNPDYSSNYAETMLSQTFDGHVGEYVISPRKGTSKEAPSSRSYKLLIYNTDKPLSAKVDGMQVTFTYNAESKCTTIEVPSASCSMERRIEVEYATSSAVASITANDAKVAYDSASTKFIASAQCSKKILVE